MGHRGLGPNHPALFYLGGLFIPVGIASASIYGGRSQSFDLVARPMILAYACEVIAVLLFFGAFRRPNTATNEDAEVQQNITDSIVADNNSGLIAKGDSNFQNTGSIADSTIHVGDVIHPPAPTTPPPPQPLDPEHRDELKAVADELSRWISLCYNPKWPRPALRRSFRRHYKDLSERIDVFDSLVINRDLCRKDMVSQLLKIAEERGLLEVPFYGIGPFISGYIGDLAIGPSPFSAHQLPFQEVPPLIHIGPWSLIDVRTSQDLEAEKHAVSKFLSDAQTTDVYIELAQAHEPVLMSRNPLLFELDDIKEKRVIYGMGDCSICGGPSDWEQP